MSCPEKCSDAAAEGTAAHLLGELTINKKVATPALWKRPDVMEGKGKSFPVTDDMSEAVGIYTQYVHWRRTESPDAEVVTEEQFAYTHIHPELFGTSDCTIFEECAVLEAIDYKHGKGVVVEIVDGDIEEDGVRFENGDFQQCVSTETVFGAQHSIFFHPPIEKVNPQLLIYGEGALEKFWGIYQDVVLTIVQPRVDHPHGPIRSVVLSQAELKRWAKEVLAPAAKACFTENPEYKMGHWCKFCPAPNCPAKLKEFQTTMGLTVSPVEISDTLKFPLITAIKPTELKNLYNLAQRFKSWADDVMAYMKEQLRTGAMTSAELGYKRVAGNTNRSWPAEYETKLVEVAGGFLAEKDLYKEPPKRSPAQIETILKDKGVTKKARDLILDKIVVETPGAPRLVPVDNPKSELPPDAENAFADYVDKAD